MKDFEPDVIVLGGGAAGLFCAITAGQRGRRVLVLEHTKRVGKKILMSGGGRCNFTNLNTTPANFISANPHFCKSALARYTPWHFVALVDSHSIGWHEKGPGQLFCNDSSKAIVGMLTDEAEQAGVQIRTQCSIQRVDPADDGFAVHTSAGTWHAPSVVVATGGLSIPKMGATGFGHALAAQFGLPLTERRAALVPFTLPHKERDAWAELAGVSADVAAQVPARDWREPLLVTHRGLSGPAMLQLSSYWQPGEALSVNWLPDESAADWLAAQRSEHPRQALRTALAAAIGKRLADVLCAQRLEPAVPRDTPLGQLTRAQQAQIAAALSACEFKPDGTEGYRTAEVTLGGVDTDALSSTTLEARDVPGLYFIGEVVDVTGQLGGYNFQWAWASGWAAGQVV